jgi:hypothetical protein
MAFIAAFSGVGFGRQQAAVSATVATPKSKGVSPNDPRFLPLKDVKPGMKGVGRTIFQGDAMEEFGVEVLGVLPGTPNPTQSLIVIRLSGKNVERTNVFAGMSGSPVFVDGKLMGAVAYSFPFGKEPLGMVTPIEQMATVFERGEIAPKRGTYSFRDLAAGTPASFLNGLSGGATPVTVGASAAASPQLSPYVGQTFAPIATPLAVAGVPPDVMAGFAPQFEAAGFRVVTGGVTAPAPIQPPAKIDDATLTPGRTVTVELVRGDFGISAAGTVTWRDGDEVLAFGHPFFAPGGIGGAGFPMSEGSVITVVPNLNNSFKLSVPSAAVGVMTQDRSTAIQGRLGQAPDMIPVTVNVATALGVTRGYKFEVVRDTFLTPILVNIGVVSSLSATERTLGELTLHVKGSIQLEGQPAVELSSSHSSLFSPANSVGLAVAQPLAVLTGSGFADAKVKEIAVTVSATDARLNGFLERIAASRVEVRRGEKIEVQAFARNANGQVFVERIPVEIPADARLGRATLLVGDGGAVNAVDRRAGLAIPNPRNVAQLVRSINQLRKGNRLYVKLYCSDSGAVVNNEEMPSLPASYLTAISGGRASAGYQPLSVATILEAELPPAQFVITGQQALTLEIVQ